MPQYSRTIESTDRSHLSFSAVAIVIVFFLVTSQVFILRLPPIATQVFRPLLIVMFLIHMQHSGSIQQPSRIFAFFVAIHALVVLLFNRSLWSQDNILEGVAVALYFMMFSLAIGVNWSKKELRRILFASFLGCFVCAVALLASNNPTDLNAASAGHLNLMGIEVNRNKNAYQYSFGVVLGMLYLLRGRRIPKPLVFLMTAVIGYALMYSQCRGAFLSFVGGATVLFISLILEARRKSGNKAFAYAILLVISYVIIYYLLKNSDLSRLVDTDSTSGRDGGIEDAWRLFLNSDWFEKLFGNGFGYEASQIEGIGAHFVYVGYLVSMGLIGTALTILVIISSGRYLFGAGAYSLFTTAVLKTFFEGADYNVFIPLILAVSISNYLKITGKRDYDLFSR